MCDYCRIIKSEYVNDDRILKWDFNKVNVSVDSYSSMLELSIYDNDLDEHSINVMINYCPFCGKKFNNRIEGE